MIGPRPLVAWVLARYAPGAFLLAKQIGSPVSTIWRPIAWQPAVLERGVIPPPVANDRDGLTPTLNPRGTP